ncbi:MAG: hypothetical protein JWQ89_2613 [Devosia sp.]|uniref:hypothetical protein n=1 Tax=Devosia sp. TaxID=1871048 RepID=UPI00261081B3|nr:hypothetical protein [Devosia sp.]MDB5540886.1 hypothetical protein [Devosia sp.]
MRKPQSMKALEDLGRVRLSENFFMRDFLHSEIASFYGIPNIPDDPDLAIAAGRRLCEEALEPLMARFGRISIRSAFRSVEVNRFGNEHDLNCGRNEANFAGHIWDRRDARGGMGATACVIVHALIPYYEATGRWEALAWWIHDHLPYDDLEFFPKFAAVNINWREFRRGRIYSFIPPRRGVLTKPGMANFEGRHEAEYAEWLAGI